MSFGSVVTDMLNLSVKSLVQEAGDGLELAHTSVGLGVDCGGLRMAAITEIFGPYSSYALRLGVLLGHLT